MNEQKLQEKHFDEDKHQYESGAIFDPPLHTQVEIALILNKIDQTKTPPIADFGAGTGRISIPLLKKGFTVHAIDISSNSLKNLTQNSKRLHLEKRLHTMKSFPPRTKYQTIVGADILHHVPILEYLPILYDHLTDGGKIIFSETAGWNPFWAVYMRIANLWDVEKGILQCTIPYLNKALTKSGFKNINISGVGFFPRPFFSFSRRMTLIADAIRDAPIIRYFAYRYLIEAEKSR